jgi:predicted ester cyclase
VVDEVIAADSKTIPLWPNPRSPLSSRADGGAEGLKDLIALYRATYPDFTSTIEELVAEGDIVVLCQTMRGTHTGAEFLGVAPTGRRVQWTSITIHRFAGGKVAEVRVLWDRLGAFQQLGVLPSQEELLPKSRPMPTTA